MTEPAASPPAPPADLDEALDRIRAHGGRLTPAKRALAALLLDGDVALTVDELAGRLGDPDRSVVYRNLAQFEQLGIAEHLHLGHGQAVYRAAGRPSIPVRCTDCGTTTEVDLTHVDDLTERIVELTGITVDLVHFPLTGTCRDCAGAGRSGEPEASSRGAAEPAG